MTLFILYAVILLVVMLAILLSALRQKTQPQHVQRREQNVRIVKEQLAVLDGSLAAGEITDAEYQQQRTELEASLLDDVVDDDNAEILAGNNVSSRRTAYTLVLFLPIFVGLSYFYIGTPEALDLQTQNKMAGHASGAQQDLPSVDEMLLRLEQRLVQQPDDINGWMMAGRSYMAMKKYPDAVKSFKRAYELDKHNAAIMFRYADALAMAHGGSLSGEAFTLLQSGLQLEPDNVMGLWLSGNAYAEQQKFPEAIKFWQSAKQLVQSEPDSVRELEMMIANAEQQLSGVRQSRPENKTVIPVAGITLTVSLSAELAKLARADEAVFILAKAMNGPPMPLAVVRKQVRDLPLTITLTDNMAMADGMSLSNYNDVVLVARVSKTGQAKAAQGDYIVEQPLRDWRNAGKQNLMIRSILGRH